MIGRILNRSYLGKVPRPTTSSGYNIEEQAFMEKGPKTVVAIPEPKAPVPPVPPRPRPMSLEKAKKLIRKTSGEHDELFRRLAR
jgi:hypothetical protein